MTKKKYKISSVLIPQTNFRKETGKELAELDTTITPIGKNITNKSYFLDKLDYFIGIVHSVIFEGEQKNIKLKKIIINEMFNKKKKNLPDELDEIWKVIEPGILNFIKVYYLKFHIEELLIVFEKRLNFVVSKYKRHLPRHVSITEGDDLITISQIELIETFKVWRPSKSVDVWPLAYSRVNGAMKDHIRYISKSDPSRFYDWVTSAAQMYLSINNDETYESKIENSSELDRALKDLSDKEKKIVIYYVNEDMTFSDISKRLNLSESQVSRIYKKAIQKIKNILKD